MFTVASITAVVLVGMLALIAPFRLAARCSRLVERARSAFLAGGYRVSFDVNGGREEDRLSLLRAWGVVTFAIFATLLMTSSTPFADHPGSFALVVLFGLVAGGLGLVIMATLRAFITLLPHWRASYALGRFGFRGLWTLDPASGAQALKDGLSVRVHGSSRLAILDVTGYEILGKGPGPAGGLLHDTIASLTGVPVSLLLLQPESQTLDPDGRRATVFQSVLADMDVSPQTFVRRIRSTLEIVQLLNEKRAPEARIEVRFYAEKPTIRALLFDDTVLVSPWTPREATMPVALIEIAREAQGATLFESYRFMIARLWSAASSREDASAKAQGFKSAAFRRDRLVHVTG